MSGPEWYISGSGPIPVDLLYRHAHSFRWRLWRLQRTGGCPFRVISRLRSHFCRRDNRCSLTNGAPDGRVTRKGYQQNGKAHGGNPLVAPQQTHHVFLLLVFFLFFAIVIREAEFLHQLINTIQLASTGLLSRHSSSPTPDVPAAHPDAHPFPVIPTPPAVKA